MSLASFLIYLLFTSPPDRRIAAVLFANVPCLVAYAWILRYRPGYNLFALMCVFRIFGVVYLFLLDLIGADREPLRVFFAILTTPVLVGGGWTLVSYRGKYEEEDIRTGSLRMNMDNFLKDLYEQGRRKRFLDL